MPAFCSHILLLAVFAGLAGIAYPRVTGDRPSGLANENAEALYLPSTEGARFASFGYRNALSNLLWFNTISYFGKHHRTDGQYRWLGHMCKLVTDLNPGEKQIFEFCGTMLAWEAERPEESIELFDAAVRAHPEAWRFYYLRGFTAMYFLNDDVSAQRDFVTASKLPGADPWMVRLATRKMATNGAPEEAVRFLEEMVRGASDENQRSALLRRLEEANHELNITRLEQALERFEMRNGRKASSLDDLRNAGIVSGNLKDPWGAPYFLDAASGEIRSASDRKRLRRRAVSPMKAAAEAAEAAKTP